MALSHHTLTFIQSKVNNAGITTSLSMFKMSTVYGLPVHKNENMAQSKPAGTANWYLKCCRGQLSSRIPPGVLTQAQRAIHQLRLNRLSSTASYQALIGQIESPTCPHCGNGDETAEHLLLLCPKLAAERQRYFGDSIDITDVFQDYESGGIPHLFGTSVPPYRQRLTGSS